MNKDEVVKTLFARAKIDPGFTTLGSHLEVSFMLFYIFHSNNHKINLLCQLLIFFINKMVIFYMG